jgi:hypothetical protein
MSATSWMPCPEEAPPDGHYWVRWARAQEETIVQVSDGRALSPRGWVPWAGYVEEWAGQYWPVPIEPPPDVWSAEAQAAWEAAL